MMRKNFFLLALIACVAVFAQAPGGVSNGLQLWYDAGVNATTTTWDARNTNFLLSKNGTGAISISPGDKSSNFNPYYTFPNGGGGTGAHFTNTLTGTLDPALLGRLHTTFAVANKLGNIDGTYNHPVRFSNFAGSGGSHVYGLGINGTNQLATLHYISGGGTIDRQNTNNGQLNKFNVISGQITSTTSGSNKLVGFNGNYQTFSDAISSNVNTNFQIGGNTYGMYGYIPEVIYYNTSLSTNDRDKVDSYLAIKYGTTLIQPKDYINSSGASIWTNSTNSGYINSIAGIGRDDASGLHQKQSNSTNPGNQVLIGIGTLGNTNITNTGSLADGQFLMWGDNGQTKSLAVPISGAPNGVNYLFGSVWRIQNTNGVGTVTVAWPQGITNLNLIRSSDATITTGDQFIPMTSTIIINGTTYNIATITFNNGDYFTFGGFGKAPGGVMAGLNAWHRADAFIYNNAGTSLATSGQAIQQWNDYNSSGFNLSQSTSTNRPIYTPTVLLNYNPTVRFTRANNQFLSYTLPISETKTQGTMYFATKQASTGIGSGIMGFDNTLDYPGWHSMATDDYLIYYASFTPTLTNKIDATRPNLIGGSWKNGAGSVATNTLYDTRYNGFSQSFNTAPNVAGTPNIYRVGSDTNYGSYDGNIGEFIYYDRDLSSTEKDRLDSYLGIKYGVTLRKVNFTSGTFNYLNAVGNTVWSGSTNASYHNNVFGIANDSSSGLDQKISNSVNSGTILKAATINNFTLSNIDSSRNSLQDNQYIIFGDNNNTSTTLIDLNPVDCPALSDGMKRIAREWRVQETGNVGSIYLEVDISGYTIGSEIALYFGDESGITGNKYIVPASSVVGGKAVFHVDFKDNNVQYFTVIGKVGPAACTTCKGGKFIVRQGTQWSTNTIRTNDDTTTFTYATDGEGNTLTARNTLTTNTPANQWIDSWFPLPYGPQALLAHVGTTPEASNTMTYTTELNRAGKVNFDLGGISEWYGNKVKVVIKGYCGSGEVKPKIREFYKGNPYNSYTIDESTGTVTGKKYYMGLSGYASVKVLFDKPVEKITITYNIVRNPVRYTHWWLTVGDMSVECDSPIEPNKDNVFLKQSFANDNISACNEAEMKIDIINNNCNSRVINITNNLPAGLEYVANTYSGLGTETPTYSGQNFNLTNLTVPPGTSTFFIKVKSSNPIAVTSSTDYNTQSIYNVTVASGGTGNTLYSDNLSANIGIQSTKLTLNPGAPPTMPKMTIVSDKPQDSCGTINYTVTIDNTSSGTATGLQLLSFLNPGQTIVGTPTFSSGLSGTFVPNPTNGETNFFIPDLAITTVSSSHTITFQTTATKIDPYAKNSVELFFDPNTNECALSAKVVAELKQNCVTCIGGKGSYDMNYAWYLGGNTARTNNEIANTVIGNPVSGQLKADAKVSYPNPSVEWYPSYFPRWYGKWTEISRYDNLNGDAGKVIYEVNLKDASNNKISAKPSFQVAGITKIAGQEDVVSIKGYCGTTEVLPIVNYDYNSSPSLNTFWRRNSIDKPTATIIGTKPYYDIYPIATANVEFEKTVDRIVIEWKVNRSPVYKTLGFLYISDINFICENVPEPNPDDIYLIADFNQETLPTCEEATLKLQFINFNCAAKQINITNTLPSNLQYVTDSYSGVGTETPSYSGQTFSVSNMTIPSGNSYAYIKVKPISSAVSTTATYTTDFKFTVIGGTNNPNPYESDDNSGSDGYQDATINYTATNVIKPTITKSVDKCFRTTSDGQGTLLTYTITVNNPSSNSISNIEFLEILDKNQKLVSGSLVNPFGGTPNDYATDENFLYISGMTIPANTSNGVITFQVKTYDTNEAFTNLATMTIDPGNAECASATQVNTGEIDIVNCPFCYKPAQTSGIESSSNHGITLLGRAGNDNSDNWPMIRKGAWTVIESKTKGFVINRVKFNTSNQPVAEDGTTLIITNAVEGMMVYDTVNHCLRIFTTKAGDATPAWHCFNNQTCPD